MKNSKSVLEVTLPDKKATDNLTQRFTAVSLGTVKSGQDASQRFFNQIILTGLIFPSIIHKVSGNSSPIPHSHCQVLRAQFHCRAVLRHKRPYNQSAKPLSGSNFHMLQSNYCFPADLHNWIFIKIVWQSQSVELACLFQLHQRFESSFRGIFFFTVTSLCFSLNDHKDKHRLTFL